MVSFAEDKNTRVMSRVRKSDEGYRHIMGWFRICQGKPQKQKTHIVVIQSGQQKAEERALAKCKAALE